MPTSLPPLLLLLLLLLMLLALLLRLLPRPVVCVVLRLLVKCMSSIGARRCVMIKSSASLLPEIIPPVRFSFTTSKRIAALSTAGRCPVCFFSVNNGGIY
jgi:hypothetical protein